MNSLLAVQDFIYDAEDVALLERKTEAALEKNAKHAEEFNTVSVASYMAAVQYFMLSLFVKFPAAGCLAWEKGMLMKGQVAPWEVGFCYSKFVELFVEDEATVELEEDHLYVASYVDQLNSVFGVGSAVVYRRLTSLEDLRKLARCDSVHHNV